MHRQLLPAGWPRPSGYSNGIAAHGTFVFIAGQIGWTAERKLAGADFVAQARQALANIVAVLEAAGGRPEHIARLTWYVTDKTAYQANLSAVGEAYRAVLGRTFPAMTLVEVSGLLETGAVVEIEATAVIPDADAGTLGPAPAR